MEHERNGGATAKDYWSPALRLQRRIEALTDRQRRYRELGLSCGEDGRRRMQAMARELDARVAEYAARAREIERAIDAVEDGEYRDLLKYRYLNGWSWQRIARQMYVSEDWVWRLHRRALRAVRLPQ